MKRWAIVLTVLAGTGCGFLGGVLFERYVGTSSVVDWTGLRHLALQYRHRDIADRVPVPRSEATKGRAMVALVFGQSNAANGGESPGQAHPGVYEFYKGRIYAARDPLLGAEGKGGSVWLHLGGLAIDRGMFDAIILVPIAVGGSKVARWAPGGSLHRWLLSVIDETRAAGLDFTHLLWLQGEADAMGGTSEEEYRERFRAMLAAVRAKGIAAPIYVARASRCGRSRPNDEIRRAQSGVIDKESGVLEGPDTDTLGLAERYDGCHFSKEGLQRAAELWLQAITPAIRQSSEPSR